MRMLPDDEAQSRREKILQAVVHLYIKTGKPVGSSTILTHFHMPLSPASIRNVLADLEKEGFLTHPHTSAGRVPTDQGYRFYVDSIVNVQRLAAEEEMRIRAEYFRRMKEIEELMKSTTRVLSTLSYCTGFALPPNITEQKLRRIELIPVDSNHILAVFVSDAGLIKDQIIFIQTIPNDEELRGISRFLNEQLGGLSFSEAQSRLTTEVNQFQNRIIRQKDFISSLSRSIQELALGTNLYVEGTSNLFNFPEFQDYESMRSFAQLVDKKEALGEVLMRELNEKGLQVRIGKESSPELKDFSVVSTSYTVNGRPVGVLGILGPKRMQYERMMAIVDTVANLVNKALSGEEFKSMGSLEEESRD